MTKGLSAKTITTINEIMETIECSNWEIDTKDKRYINYKCHCGKDGKTLKQGIFRPQWNGCSECSKKKISSEVIDLITDILKKNKCELISFGKGTRVGLLFVTVYTSTSVSVSNYQYAELVFED